VPRNGAPAAYANRRSKVGTTREHSPICDAPSLTSERFASGSKALASNPRLPANNHSLSASVRVQEPWPLVAAPCVTAALFPPCTPNAPCSSDRVYHRFRPRPYFAAVRSPYLPPQASALSSQQSTADFIFPPPITDHESLITGPLPFPSNPPTDSLPACVRGFAVANI
jgi:hypothetical protein